MDQLIKKVIASTLAGFLGAVVVDLDKWKTADSDHFDWKLAVKRWIQGAVTGAITALGMNAV
jgi:hypothetical protein